MADPIAELACVACVLPNPLLLLDAYVLPALALEELA